MTMLLLFAAFACGAYAQRGGEVRPDLLYHNYCSVCHGDRGDGRSRARASLNPSPTDFTTPQAREMLSRARMILALQHGRPGTAMTSWTTQLSQQEIEAVVDYVRDTMMLPEPGTPLAKGRAVYLQHCASCHGDRGQGVAASPSHPAPRPFRASAERSQMLAAVAKGEFGRLPHGFAGRLKADEIENTVDYVRKSLAPGLAPGVSGTHAHGGRGRDAAPSVDHSAPLPRGLAGNAQRGQRLYEQNCVACHGAKGDGNGPRPALVGGKPRELGATPLNRPALYAAIAEGKPGTDMPAWSAVLERQPLADLAEYLWRTWYAPARPARAN
jgi:mono/diheme cytochrome c family protein